MYQNGTDEHHALASIKVKSSHRAEAAKILFEAMMTSRQEPGNLYYYITRDLENPNVFHFVDGWRTAADFDMHLKSERVKETIAVLETMLDGTISMFSGRPLEAD